MLLPTAPPPTPQFRLLTDFTLMYQHCVGVLLKRDTDLATKEVRTHQAHFVFGAGCTFCVFGSGCTFRFWAGSVRQTLATQELCVLLHWRDTLTLRLHTCRRLQAAF